MTDTDTVVAKASLNINDTPANIPSWVVGVGDIDPEKHLRKDHPALVFSSPRTNRPISSSRLASAPPPVLLPDENQIETSRQELDQAARVELPSDNSKDETEELEGAVGGNIKPSSIYFGADSQDQTKELEGAVGGHSRLVSTRLEESTTGLEGAAGGNLETEVDTEGEVFYRPISRPTIATPYIPPLQTQQVVPPTTIQTIVTQQIPVQTTAAQQIAAPVTIQVTNPQIASTQVAPVQQVVTPVTTQVAPSNFHLPKPRPNQLNSPKLLNHHPCPFLNPNHFRVLSH